MIFLDKFNSLITLRTNTRLALIDKLSLTNTYACPDLLKACLFIDLKGLENFDSPRLLAAIFVLTLLGGTRPYVVRFNLFQTFHEKDYDAKVVLDLNSIMAYKFSQHLSTYILPFLSKADFSFYALKNSKGVIVNFTIADLSFIRVIETHSIFFK